MARIDRQKRALGGAVKRTKPSRAAEILIAAHKINGRVLDYGCGYGFDADHRGWDAYDPYYRPTAPTGPYDTIVYNYVLNALSKGNREQVIEKIRDLLAEDGVAYLAVPRDVPVTGKLGMNHSLQNYVVLTLPSVFSDSQLEIYEMRKQNDFEDRTKDYISRRDRRRD